MQTYQEEEKRSRKSLEMFANKLTGVAANTISSTILATFIFGQVLLCIGINFGMHSITLIQVPAEQDAFLSGDQLNWTIAITMLGGLLGGLLAVPLSPMMGARRLLLLAMPLHVLGALAVGLGSSFIWTMVGRAMMFMVLGMTQGPARAYISEIVPPKRRALFSTSLSSLGYMSQVAVLAVAPWMHWQTLFLVAGCAPPIVCVCGLLFIPDSAKWLLAHGHCPEEARRSVLFYHPHVDAADEVRKVQDSLEHAHHAASLWTLLRQPETLRPLLLGAGQMVLFCWCGGQTLVLITAVILQPLALPLDSYQRAMVVPALGVLLTVPSIPLIEWCGRLPTLRAGGAMSAFGCATIAAYFFLDEESQARLGWIGLVGAVVVAIPYFCVIAPVSFGYVSELLPNRTRALGANIIMTSMNVNLFVLLKLYPLMQERIGLGGAFALHAAASLLQVLYATLCLVETKGLSLDQMQHLFQSDRKSRSELPTLAAEPSGKIAPAL